MSNINNYSKNIKSIGKSWGKKLIGIDLISEASGTGNAIGFSGTGIVS